MKKKFIVIFIILAILVLFYINSKKENISEENRYDTTKIEEIKNESGVVGESDLYEISKDYNGEESISIRADLQYKVALGGAVLHTAPEIDKIDEQIKNLPKEKGLWIENQSRQKFLELINEVSGREYHINENGYLDLNNKDEYSKKLNKIVKKKKTIRIAFASSYYLLDEVTGEIVEFPYEEADPYQIYECFEAEDESLILITNNTKEKYTNTEILQEILENII